MSARPRQQEGTGETHRILVVANETVGGPVLAEAVRFRARGGRLVDVLVVAPTLNSHPRHWLSDEGEARRAAEARLGMCRARFRKAAIAAGGWVGDADPLQSIEDSLNLFAADEVIISTHPEGRSNWLARNVVERARARYSLPVAHLRVCHAALGWESLDGASRVRRDGSHWEAAAA